MRSWLLGLLLLVPLASGASEKLVFQANAGSSGFGYDVNTGGAYKEGCPSLHESCLTFVDNSFEHNYVGIHLDGKHAYRVPFAIYADLDGGTSIFTTTFSFLSGGITSGSHGDGSTSGVYGQSIGVRLKETHGWDLSLLEVTDGKLQTLASGSDGRTSNAWRTFTLFVNTDTGDVHVLDDLDTVLVSAHLGHHAGAAVTSQWFQGHGDNWWTTAKTWLRVGGTSTAVYDMDPRPPVISNLTQNPQLVAPGQSVQLSATIRDDWGTATAVVKRWTNGAPQSNVAMHASGTTYTATLPGADKGVVVRYQVVATGVSGLTAASDTIQYVVGSSKAPSDLGGSGFIRESKGMDAALAFVMILGFGVFLWFIERKQISRAVAAWIVPGAAVLGVSVAVYMLHADAVNHALASPLLLPVGITAAAVVVGAAKVRRRPGGAP